jgi:hypothetical protein
MTVQRRTPRLLPSLRFGGAMKARRVPRGPVEQARRFARQLRELGDQIRSEVEALAAEVEEDADYTQRFFEAWNRHFEEKDGLIAKSRMGPRPPRDDVAGLRAGGSRIG